MTSIKIKGTKCKNTPQVYLHLPCTYLFYISNILTKSVTDLGTYPISPLSMLFEIIMLAKGILLYNKIPSVLHPSRPEHCFRALSRNNQPAYLCP